MKIHLAYFIRFALLFSLLLSLLPMAGCPSEKEAPASEAPAATPPPTAQAPAAAAQAPTAAAQAAAEARRAQQPRTTTEVRAGWALEACAAGCDARQEAIATRLSADAQLVPLSRDEKAVGLQLIALRAYSPWIACRLQPGDLVIAVGARAIRLDADIPTVIRACTLGQALTVERRGKKTAIPARAGKDAEAKVEGRPPVPAGTLDLP